MGICMTWDGDEVYDCMMHEEEGNRSNDDHEQINQNFK